MHIDYNALGQRVKKVRKQKRFTQEKLAEDLEVSTVYISQVENGKTKLSLEMLVRIADLLEQTPAIFLQVSRTICRITLSQTLPCFYRTARLKDAS